MRINLRGAWTGLPILLAMGLSGGGVALWRDLRPPQAAVTRDAALQTQWRRDGADPVLVNGTRAFFLAGALRDESAFVFAGP